MYSCENLEKLLVFSSIQSMVLRMKATAVLSAFPKPAWLNSMRILLWKNRAPIIDCICSDMVQSRCSLPVTEGDEVKMQIGNITAVRFRLPKAVGQHSLTNHRTKTYSFCPHFVRILSSVSQLRRALPQQL